MLSNPGDFPHFNLEMAFDNYRGISVTSALGKLFNSILNNRLDMFLEKHQIIDTCQVGFTKKARTTDHLFITY
jgi:hypothetical protein